MTTSSKRRIAVGIFIVTLGGCAIGIVGLVNTWHVSNEGVWAFRGFGIVGALVFAGSGTLLAYKRSDNPVGWLFAAAGLAFAGLTAGEVYAGIPLIQGRDNGAIYPVAWVTSWAWVIFMATIAFAILLFPTGRLPGPRWRMPARLMAGGFVVGMLSFAFTPGPINNFPEYITNRYALPPGLFADLLQAVGMLWMVGAMATAAVAVITRFRASRGVQRQQMKLFALAAGVMGVSFLLLPLSELFALFQGDVLEVVSSLAMMAVPIAMTIAILRYRLYDIDVVINRALVYGLLTAALLASYLVIVVTLGRVLDPVTRDSDVAVAASTLAVAAFFRPLRARIQGFIDRRFYRAKYDASRALHAFGTRLRDQVDVEAVRGDVLTVVGTTVQPSHASVWLRQESS